MSVQQDRLTFFGVLIAVVVVVVGYLQIGRMYPTTGRAEAVGKAQAQPVETQAIDREEEAGGGELAPGEDVPR